MTAGELVRLRLWNQQLARPEARAPADIVRWLGAVQAQDYAAAKWALALRATGVTDEMVERAFNDGLILRTHVLRPTWHFVAPEDIRWMIALTAPRVKARLAPYHRKYGLDDALFARSRKTIARALGGGTQLTRAELAAALERSGIRAAGIALAFLMIDAELEQIVCSGARRGGHHTYARLEERARGAAPESREEALAELTRRYFESHGPATIRDYAWWSGLTVRDAQIGIDAAGSSLACEAIGGIKCWFAASHGGARRVAGGAHLLPNYDEYLVAYKDRDWVIDRAKLRGAALSNPFTNALVIDGRMAGTWRPAMKGKTVMIDVAARRLAQRERRALDAAVARYGQYLGKPVTTRSATKTRKHISFFVIS